MHAGRRFTFKELFLWSWNDTKWLILLSAIPTLIYIFITRAVAVPWQPVALLGTALSFIVGFKNNASYGRLWEARQVYGGIINDSRSFGYTVRDILGGKHSEIVKTILYRHVAWLTALRFQLREHRTWENTGIRKNVKYREHAFKIPEWDSNLDDELDPFLSVEDKLYVMTKKNKAAQLLAIQSEHFIKLKRETKINDFEWSKVQDLLHRLTDHQGKAERIKNFPYPRNFASITTYIVLLFVIILPFGLLRELDKWGDGTSYDSILVWLNIPICSIVSWVFYALNEVGESSVNPFEGNANDIPITQISRTIEIDLRDMLDETSLPPAISPVNNIVL
ncbi:MAG TPA: bestrophin family ion channel [Saprospiraceae bacterium]|mgnify:CR=1 FL=1|nr:bestrophin family ion channel [Saprospiraceae bacterium]